MRGRWQRSHVLASPWRSTHGNDVVCGQTSPIRSCTACTVCVLKRVALSRSALCPGATSGSSLMSAIKARHVRSAFAAWSTLLAPRACYSTRPPLPVDRGDGLPASVRLALRCDGSELSWAIACRSRATTGYTCVAKGTHPSANCCTACSSTACFRTPETTALRSANRPLAPSGRVDKYEGAHACSQAHPCGEWDVARTMVFSQFSWYALGSGLRLECLGGRSHHGIASDCCAQDVRKTRSSSVAVGSGDPRLLPFRGVRHIFLKASLKLGPQGFIKPPHPIFPPNTSRHGRWLWLWLWLYSRP